MEKLEDKKHHSKNKEKLLLAIQCISFMQEKKSGSFYGSVDYLKM